MKTRSLSAGQAGGLTLIASMAVMFAGAVFANLTLALNQTSFGGEPEEILAAIAANPSLWRLADILILAAIVLTALGFVPITPEFEGKGRLWAQAALLVFAFSAVLGGIRRIASIYLEPWVALEGIALNDTTVQAFSRFGEGLGEWFTLLAFSAVALYGIAFLRSRTSGSVGWVFIGGGAAGIVVHLVGAGIPAFIFLETGALGAALLLRKGPPG